MSIVIAIVVFLVIILIHEFGHFIAAKACGIYVREFALGMGPVILRKKGKETEYVVRALPIGGSCTFDDDYEEGVVKNPRSFGAKPVWQRIIVILAGPLMNLILGYIVVVISLVTAPAMASTTIYQFKDQSVSSSQLRENDRIIAVEGMPVFSVTDISYKLQNSGRKNEDGNLVFDFTVRRNGEKVELSDVEFMTVGEGVIYYDFFVYGLEKNFKNVAAQGFRESLSTSRLIIMTLVDIVRGKYGLNDLTGVIGVGVEIEKAVRTYTFSDLMTIISLITINLGVFNLIPIPALDGARLVFLIVEAIRRKPTRPEVEGMVHFVGFALLMVLMVVVTFNDIVKLFTGGYS